MTPPTILSRSERFAAIPSTNDVVAGWLADGVAGNGIAVTRQAFGLPTAYAADSAPPGMNATTLSTYRMVGDLGYILGPVLLGMLADWFGAVTSLVAVSVVMASVGVIFAIFAPETYRRQR